MKTRILIAAIFLISMYSYAQSIYYPLIDIGKTWHILHHNWGSTLIYTYRCDGDTLINNSVYKILFSTEDEFAGNWIKHGYIREDEDKKVYYSPYHGNDSLFYDPAMVYDFNAEINDTLLISSFAYNYPNELEIVITEIDSVLIGDNFRKKISFECGYNYFFENSWIEGIGSLNGLLEPGFYCYIACPTLELLCVKEDETVIYQHPYYNECYIVGIEDNISNQIKFEIYPNPADETVFIISKDVDNSNYTFTILNSIGQVLILFDIESLGANKVFVGDLNSGLYFYTIKNDLHLEQTGKLVIQ